MYFVYIIIGIAIISFVLALRSLKQLSKNEEIGSVKQELKKGRVIFHGDNARVRNENEQE